MMFGLNRKCIWQHPTTGNHLGLTKIVSDEVDQPILKSVKSLQQPQPRTWELPIE